MGFIGVLIGALVGVGLDIFGSEYLFDLIVSMCIAFFFMAAGNMMNDYFDRDLDKINHPERPIPSGLLQPEHVLLSAILIFALILLLGFLINLIMFSILLTALVLMIGYEIILKRQGFVGNIAISILVGMLFLFGAALVLKFGVVIFLALLAFLATITREIVKDIEDLEGDKDRFTLPKRIGKKNAAVMASIFLIIAIILSPVPAFPWLLPFQFLEFESLTINYFYLIILGNILFVFAIFNFTKKPTLAQNLLKAAMVISLLAFAVGSITI
jgi:geranylgeranylglycerol-phosphate geranylgeranyltransferase